MPLPLTQARTATNSSDTSPRCVPALTGRSDAIGVAIPYGIDDLLANRGSVFVGVSHDTAAFAAHSIAGWWKRHGADRYRRGRQLLVLADTGGSNNCRTSAWKTELQRCPPRTIRLLQCESIVA